MEWGLRYARFFALALIAAPLAACGGGGGSSGSFVPAVPAAHVATAAPTPTGAAVTAPQAAERGVAGVVVDLPYDGTNANPGYSVIPPNGTAPRAGSAIAGAAVFVGPQIVAGATPPPSTPAGFVTATTDARGAFHISNPPAGHVAISIFAPSPHTAALHADISLTNGMNPVTTFYLTVPTAIEAGWLAGENDDRALFGVSPVGMDEAALEAARYWAAFMQRNDYFAHCIPASACITGDTTPPPASYGPQDVDPDHRFHYEHGFSGALEGENIASGFPSWQTTERAFMAEQSLCPNGQALNCPFDDATGHFLNIIDAEYTWSGLGVVAPVAQTAYFDQEFSVLESSTPSTSSHLRSPARFARGLRMSTATAPR